MSSSAGLPFCRAWPRSFQTCSGGELLVSLDLGPECPLEHGLYLRLKVEPFRHGSAKEALLDHVPQQLPALLITRDLYSLGQFEHFLLGHLSGGKKKKQQHEAVRSDKSCQRQSFDDAQMFRKLLAGIVAAAAPGRAAVAMDQVQAADGTRTFLILTAHQPLYPSVFNGGDQFAAAAAPPAGRSASSQ